MSKHDLTIAVLTKNEEENILRCLNAIPKNYDVVIVDSGSTDKTIEIATSHGCAVHHSEWRGFAAQRNFALESCNIKTKWVLFVDADEVYPATFFGWFEQEITGSDNIDVAIIPSFLVLNGKRLNYAPGYPVFHPRLVRRNAIKFSTNHTGHGESINQNSRSINGTIPYDHYFFNGDVRSWLHKHVENAAKEYRVAPTTGAKLTTRGRISILLGSSFLRVPGRFVYHYILKKGYKDGRAGFQYSLMYTWYEATKYIFHNVDRTDGSE